MRDRLVTDRVPSHDGCRDNGLIPAGRSAEEIDDKDRSAAAWHPEASEQTPPHCGRPSRSHNALPHGHHSARLVNSGGHTPTRQARKYPRQVALPPRAWGSKPLGYEVLGFFRGSPERPLPGIIYSLHPRRLIQREQHRSYHSNMIGVVAKTTNSNVFSALPFDPGNGLRQLSHPSQHFVFGCLTSPMQSLTASYNSPLNNLWVCGSKEDGPPNHPISPVDYCGPPIGKSANSPTGR
jgi:hypothetical protein